MSEKIEFEATVSSRYVEMDGRIPMMAMPKNVECGDYHVTLTPVEPELKPCPQCGDKAEWESKERSTVGHWRFTHHRIVCSSERCGRRTGWRCVAADALYDWNRRAE